MKQLILFLLMAFGLEAVDFDYFGTDGPATVYRGKTAYFTVRGGWMDWRTVTDIQTTEGSPANTLTMPAHGIAEGATIRFKSTGTLPDPYPNAMTPLYAKNRTTDTIQTQEIVGYAATEIMDTGTGTMSVGTVNSTAGSVGYVISTPIAGITVASYQPGGWTGNFAAITYPNSGSIMNLAIAVADTTALGATSLTITLTHASFGSPLVITIPITVSAMPTFNVTRPASSTTVPMLTEFAQHLKALGARNCDKTTGAINHPTTFANISAFSFSTETQIWYYDGGWGFDQMAEFLGDDEWRNCGDTVASRYRNGIFSGAAGINTAWRAFPDGMVERMRTTRDGRYKHALNQMATGFTVYSTTGAGPGWYLQRENAYNLSLHVSNSELRGEPLPIAAIRSVEFLLATFEATHVNESDRQGSAFWDALSMQALIKYWQLTGDTRVPHAIKAGLDWLWDNNWDPVTGTFYYVGHEYGTNCRTSCRPDTTYNSLLTALILPGYGWYYSVTGDTVYRDRGDEAFQRIPFHFIPESISGNTFTLPNHGFEEGETYSFIAGGGAGVTSSMYIRNPTTDTYQIGYQSYSVLTIPVGTQPRSWLGRRSGDNIIDSTNGGKVTGQNLRWIIKYVRWRQLLD